MPDLPAAPLETVVWQTTRACNLRCPDCRIAEQTHVSPWDLTTTEAHIAIDEIASVGTPAVLLSGGEALYRADVFALARHGRRCGLRMVLVTNGTMIDAQVARWIRASGFARAAVGLDGPGPGTHEVHRGQTGSYRLAMAGIRHLIAAGVPVHTQTLVTASNLDELGGIVDEATRLGVRSMQLFVETPAWCGFSTVVSGALDAEGKAWVIAWALEEAARRGVEIAAWPRVPSPGAACFIGHAGDVFAAGSRERLVGSLRERTFDAIWRDPLTRRALSSARKEWGALVSAANRSQVPACGGRAAHRRRAS